MYSEKFKKIILPYLMIILGALLTSIGTNFYLIPMNTFPIGIMGLSGEIANIIGFIPGVGGDFMINILTWVIYFILNIGPMILAWTKLSRRFAIRTITYIIFVTIFGLLIPSSFVDGYAIPEALRIYDPLTSIIFAAFLLGIGLALSLKFGSSTGGTDIFAMYLSVYKDKSFTKINFVFNFFVVIGAVLIALHPNIADNLDDQGQIEIAALMVIMLIVWTLTINYLYDINKKITLLIITNHKNEISQWIIDHGNRTTTIIDSIGSKSKQPNNILLLTITSLERKKFINGIRKIDEKVWIAVLKNEEVIGEFDNYTKNIL